MWIPKLINTCTDGKLNGAFGIWEVSQMLIIHAVTLTEMRSREKRKMVKNKCSALTAILKTEEMTFALRNGKDSKLSI